MKSLPSMTWVSTINLITLAGAKPVFVDVDRDTLMVSAQSIQQAITPKTKLIVPVHFAGAACDLDEIFKVANAHKIPVVQDSAHAIGTFYKDKHVGSTGTSIYSFHPIKNITTGEGGTVCSDNTELIERIKRLKFHGLGQDALHRESQGRSPFSESFRTGLQV